MAPGRDGGLAGTNWVGIAGGNTAVDGGYSVDLTRLRPGRYTLSVSAAAGSARAGSKRVPFTIVS